MKLLVDAGYYTDPESWDDLDTAVQDAWKVIGSAWWPDKPS